MSRNIYVEQPIKNSLFKNRSNPDSTEIAQGNVAQCSIPDHTNPILKKVVARQFIIRKVKRLANGRHRQ